MTKPRISQVLLGALAIVTLALFGFFVALVAGALPVDDPPAPPPDTGALPQSPTEPAEEPATTAVTKRARATTPPPVLDHDHDHDDRDPAARTER